MATRYLGEQFDIHGGGLDLRFPHHENELAQSSAAGHGFAKYWIHNGLVNTGGQKMSKSLGNSLFAHDLLAQTRPIVLRYFLGSAHYRSVLEFSETSLDEAAAAFSRIEGFLDRAASFAPSALPEPMRGAATHDDVPSAFADALFDDFAMPQALAALHGAVRAGNIAIDEGDEQAVAERAAEVVAMLDVMGIDPRDAIWRDGSAAGSAREQQALGTLVDGMLADRREARANKDFAASDAIRDRLIDAGIALEDSPHETRWSLT